MSSTKPKVVAAMSGGVDSSVSAALLVEQGYEVIGVMMRLWAEPCNGGGAYNRCCTPAQMLDAESVADLLGIPFHVVDLRAEFKAQVVDPFIETYSAGLTPNPCLACNRHIRFTHLLEHALSLGAEYLATGHYARITREAGGLYELRKGVDEGKDQSYVLSVLDQAQLARTLLPVGGYIKRQVREMAARFGLPVARKCESQDLCFLADGDYRRFLREQVPDAVQSGPILNRRGEVLGQHSGLVDYTIGQRKGLGISAPEALYVLAIDSAANALVVGTRAELGADRLVADGVNWIAGCPPERPLRAEVKIRYRARPAPALVVPLEMERVEVRFDRALPDITPGQGAVFYDGERVLGGGIIRQVGSQAA
jgi:tRNA-specific 2-thiouridylase